MTMVTHDASRIRIAQVKAYPVKGDLAGNAGRLMSILAQVEEHAPDVVVTPECFLDGYVATEEMVTRENIADFAIDPASSRYASEAAEWAWRNSSWLIFGCTRKSPDGVYNSALLYNRDGRLAGSYDKVHCQTQDKKFSPGQSLPVFESDFGPFGVMICADRRWPETVRTLSLKGARVIFNPTYGMHDERNLHMMQTRSYESEVFIAFTHPGQSLVTDPSGGIVCNTTDEAVEFSVCEIDLSEVDRIRSPESPSAHLKDRRPDVYER
jgi:predicted amidohydrolase